MGAATAADKPTSEVLQTAAETYRQLRKGLEHNHSRLKRDEEAVYKQSLEADRLFLEDHRTRPRTLQVQNIRWPGVTAEQIANEFNARLGAGFLSVAGLSGQSAVLFCRLLPPQSTELEAHATASSEEPEKAADMMAPTAKAEVAFRTHEQRQELLNGLKLMAFTTGRLLPSDLGQGDHLRLLDWKVYPQLLQRCAALDLVVPAQQLQLGNSLAVAGSAAAPTLAFDAARQQAPLCRTVWWSNSNEVQMRVNVWARTLGITFHAPLGGKMHKHHIQMGFDDIVGCGTVSMAPAGFMAEEARGSASKALKGRPGNSTVDLPPDDDNWLELGVAADVLGTAPVAQTDVLPAGRTAVQALELSWVLRWPPRVYHAPLITPGSVEALPRNGTAAKPAANGNSSKRKGRGGEAYVSQRAVALTQPPAAVEQAGPQVWPDEAARITSKPWFRSAPVNDLDFTKCEALAHCRTITIVLRYDATTVKEMDRVLNTLTQSLLLPAPKVWPPPPTAIPVEPFNHRSWEATQTRLWELPFEVKWAVDTLRSAGLLCAEQISRPLLTLMEACCTAGKDETFRLEAALYDCKAVGQQLTAEWLKERLRVRATARKAAIQPSIAYDAGLRKEEAQRQDNDESVVQLPVVEQKQQCVLTKRVLITPTRVVALAPERELTNRVLRQYSEYQDNFIRVSFADESGESLHMAAGVVNEAGQVVHDAAREVRSRNRHVLLRGFQAAGRHHELLAFSSSQLREGSAWFLAPIKNELEVTDIHYWLGDFQGINNVAKYAARLGQAFTSSYHSLMVPESAHSTTHDVVLLDDSDADGRAIKYCFSDGVGLIGMDLARQVMRKMGQSDHLLPRAMQVRYRGCKGMLAPWSSDILAEDTVQVRPSMTKYDLPAGPVEIVSLAGFMAGFLNRQIILLMDHLGTPPQAFLRKAKLMLDELNNAMVEGPAALRLVRRFNFVDGPLSATLAAALAGGVPPTEPFIQGCLQAARLHGLQDVRNKARIFVEDSAFLFGIMDETGTLQYGEVFVQIQRAGGGVTLAGPGPVMVTKNPCLAPGDVRLLQCVDVPALRHLVNVVVFPRQGTRPHPNEISGSDLDGDVFFVCWDAELIPARQVTPMDYTAPLVKQERNGVRFDQVVDFYLAFQANDRLGQIDNAHLVHADLNGAGCKECTRLAELHVLAVDYGKTGVSAVLEDTLRPKKYPHFMEKPDKSVYRSHGVLGQLYDLAVNTEREWLSYHQQQDKLRRHARPSEPLCPPIAPTILPAKPTQRPRSAAPRGVDEAWPEPGEMATKARKAGRVVKEDVDDPSDDSGDERAEQAAVQAQHHIREAAQAAAAAAAIAASVRAAAVAAPAAGHALGQSGGAAHAAAGVPADALAMDVAAAAEHRLQKAAQETAEAVTAAEATAAARLAEAAPGGMAVLTAGGGEVAADGDVIVSVVAAPGVEHFQAVEPPRPALLTDTTAARKAKAAADEAFQAAVARLAAANPGTSRRPPMQFVPVGAARCVDKAEMPPMEASYDPSMVLADVDGFWREVEAVLPVCLNFNADIMRLMNRYGITSECELITGWLMQPSGHQRRKKSDLRQQILLEVGRMRHAYRERLRSLDSSPPSAGNDGDPAPPLVGCALDSLQALAPPRLAAGRGKATLAAIDAAAVHEMLLGPAAVARGALLPNQVSPSGIVLCSCAAAGRHAGCLICQGANAPAPFAPAEITLPAMLRASAAYYTAYCESDRLHHLQGHYANCDGGDGWGEGQRSGRRNVGSKGADLRLLCFAWLLHDELMAAREYKLRMAAASSGSLQADDNLPGAAAADMIPKPVLASEDLLPSNVTVAKPAAEAPTALPVMALAGPLHAGA